jgi:hypothetical protein
VEFRGLFEVAFEFLELLKVFLSSFSFCLLFLFVIEAFQFEFLLELLIDVSHLFLCILDIPSPLEQQKQLRSQQARVMPLLIRIVHVTRGQPLQVNQVTPLVSPPDPLDLDTPGNLDFLVLRVEDLECTE